MSRSCITDKGSSMQPPQSVKVEPTKKAFVMGKYYKCVDNLGKEEILTKDKYYYLNDMRDGNFWTTSLDGLREGVRFFMLDRFDINSESDYDLSYPQYYAPAGIQPPKVEDPYKHTAYVKFKGYSGQYDSKEYCYKCDDRILSKHIEQLTMEKIYAIAEAGVGAVKEVQIQRITKDYLDSKATKCIIGIVEEEKTKSRLDDIVQVTINRDDFFSKEMTDYLSVSKSGNNATTNVGDVSMSVQRKSVKVELFDNDQGLPVEYSLVGSWTDYVTEDSDGITVQEIISTGDVADLLQQHNEVRVGLIDEEILTRTGNSVNLRPIKLKNLTWMVDGRKVN